MYCGNCGTEVDEGVKYCPNCGNPIDSSEVKGFKYDPDAEENGNYSTDGNFSGNDNRGSNGGPVLMPLKTDRNVFLFVLLSIITCGIYYYVFIYELARDVNIACNGDGEKTPGLLEYILLSIVTLGLYNLYWCYKLGNRLSMNATRYGKYVNENGTTVLLWMLVGMFVCCIGPFIAWSIIINLSNTVCLCYNKANGFM